jgi:hypothetical protein
MKAMLSKVIGLGCDNFTPQVFVASDFAVTFASAVSVLPDSAITLSSSASKFSDFS